MPWRCFSVVCLIIQSMTSKNWTERVTTETSLAHSDEHPDQLRKDSIVDDSAVVVGLLYNGDVLLRDALMT